MTIPEISSTGVIAIAMLGLTAMPGIWSLGGRYIQGSGMDSILLILFDRQPGRIDRHFTNGKSFMEYTRAYWASLKILLLKGELISDLGHLPTTPLGLP